MDKTSTSATRKINHKKQDSYMNIKELKVGSTILIEDRLCFVEKINRIADSTYKVEYIDETARRGKEFYMLADKITVEPNDIVEENKTKKKLNKPFRTSGGPKKFSVYVKNENGNVVKVNFGDPDMEIKRDSPTRRKSFRARHKCESPGPKTKAKYWSCYQWRKSSPVSDDVEYTGNFILERTNKDERNLSEETKSAISTAVRLKVELLPESYKKTKRMDKNEKTYHETITRELERTKAFKTLNLRYKKDIHKEVSKMILIANDLLTKEKK